MPGPGASSPIIVDGKVFVTCYSGYGLSQDDPGDIKNLMRHLICVDLATGERFGKQMSKHRCPRILTVGSG